ncbi:MAG: zinc metalloprotease HtpX [Chromatiaceae bacterium]|nr:zinc metalloprotease HtpX [Chromatiaceae bacterium]
MQSNQIDEGLWRQHVWRNRLQSLVLLASMAGFLALLGWLLWGGDGVMGLLVGGAFAVMFNPTMSPGWVMRLYGASPIGSATAPALWNAVGVLAERAGLPDRPALYYLPSSMLNAFAVGNRRHSAIAVTDGLVRGLTSAELVGVLAHEISHIRHNDLWVMGLADMFSRATSLLSLMGQFLLLLNLPLMLLTEVRINWFAILLLIFAPVLSSLAQLALSRTREYDADLNAVRLTGDADGLAGALRKIERVQGGWLERILMPGRRVPDPSLLRTHPETSERVERLMSLKASGMRSARLAAHTRAEDRDWKIGTPVTRAPRWHITGLWH